MALLLRPDGTRTPSVWLPLPDHPKPRPGPTGNHRTRGSTARWRSSRGAPAATEIGLLIPPPVVDLAAGIVEGGRLGHMVPAAPYRGRDRPVLTVMTIRDLQVHIAQAGRVSALPRDLVGMPFRETLHDPVPVVQPLGSLRIQLLGPGHPVQIATTPVRLRSPWEIVPAEPRGDADQDLPIISRRNHSGRGPRSNRRGCPLIDLPQKVTGLVCHSWHHLGQTTQASRNTRSPQVRPAHRGPAETDSESTSITILHGTVASTSPAPPGISKRTRAVAVSSYSPSERSSAAE